MLSMSMRTTITVPDPLLVEIKQVAAAKHTSLTAIVVESLRRYLAEAREETPRIDPLPIVRGAKPRRGVDLDDTSALLELD